MEKITLLLVSLLLVTVSCQPAPTSAQPTPTVVPPTSTPALVSPTPTAASNVNAILTLTAPKPKSSGLGALPQATIHVGYLDRTFSYYVPANLPRNAPLLFAFHGDHMNAELMRDATGYEFETLADRNGFIIVYPNGYQTDWNDCRKGVMFLAKKENIDDVAFVRALIARFHADYGTNTSQVFAMGYSNGAHLTYRLALELADEITAIATVAANLPTDDDLDCRASGKPIPVLIMNGTSDVLNPYNGGIGNYGTNLRSAQGSAEYFAKVNGQLDPPKTTRLPHPNAADLNFVERTVWNIAGKPEVVLDTINGGGHLMPKTNVLAPSYLPRTVGDLDGPTEIWDFFSRQRSLK